MAFGPIIFDLESLVLTADEKALLKHPLVGGIILFARNYESPEQLHDLVKSIRKIKPQALLMVDQEGGRVQRFKEGFTKLPNIRLLGQLYDHYPDNIEQCKSFAFHLGLLMALEVRRFDIDLSLGPVVDLDKGISAVIGDRAFHHASNGVIELARSYIEGMAHAHMPATLKHFPGHGSVAPDSHHELPIDERIFSEMEDDLSSFKVLCVDKNVKAVMPGHLLFSQLDNKPACFSKFWLQDVLRAELNFEGVIISDDLSMEGACVIGNYPERVQTALDAGCDLVLLCNHREGLKHALECVDHDMSDASKARVEKLRAPKPVFRWPDNNHPLWIQAHASMQKFLGQCMHMNPTLV